jgi:hypothetical protein
MTRRRYRATIAKRRAQADPKEKEGGRHMNGGETPQAFRRSLESDVKKLLEEIGCTRIGFPVTFDSPIGDATPYVSIGNAKERKYAYIISERGQEFDRRETDDYNELLFWILESVTFGMACEWELKNRMPGQDFRRLLFRKQEELLAKLNASWADIVRAKHSAVLRDHPFNDMGNMGFIARGDGDDALIWGIFFWNSNPIRELTADNGILSAINEHSDVRIEINLENITEINMTVLCQCEGGALNMHFKEIAGLFGIKEQIGVAESSITEAEKKIGPMPSVLRSYYRELGAHEALNRTQDRLLGPEELLETDGHILFYTENQDVCEWGVAKSDWQKPDPPVYRSYDRKEWVLEAERLSDFLVAMAHWQAIFAYEYSSYEYSSIGEYPILSQESAEKIRAAFNSKNLTGFRYWDAEFFGWREAILVLLKDGESCELLYSAPEEACFAALDEKIRSLLKEDGA